MKKHKLLNKRNEKLFDLLLEGVGVTFKSAPKNEEAPTASPDVERAEDAVKAAAKEEDPDKAANIAVAAARALGKDLDADAIANTTAALSKTRDSREKVAVIMKAIQDATSGDDESGEQTGGPTAGPDAKPDEEGGEEAGDKYPPLKLAGEKGKIDTLGIIKWLKDYPGVEPANLKKLAVAMDKYFAPSGKKFNNWKTNAKWTFPAATNFTNKLISMNEEAVKNDIEQALGGYKTSDAKRLQAFIGKNPTLLRQMALINNRAEYEEVIIAITDLVNDKIPNPSDIATGLKNVLSKYAKVAPQLKGGDEKLDAKTAPLTRGPAAVGNTKMKGGGSLKDIMKSRNIPADAIKQVLVALAGEFKINNIPFKEGLLRENKKRKVVIRYAKRKTKKK